MVRQPRVDVPNIPYHIINRGVGRLTIANNQTTAYTYDALNRLLSASTTGISTFAPYSRSYTYNALGNITSVASPTVTTHTYAGTGYANPHAPTTIGGVVYGYDANGNVTSAGDTLSVWDYANRLTALGMNGATTTFGYDYSGQRVISQTASSTTVFPNKYFSVTSMQVGSSTLATSTSYIFANDQLVAFVEQPLIDGVATGTAATYYVHPDHLGSINVLSTASGTVQFVKDYLPYGAERLTSGDTGMRRGYIGEFEEGGNLSYLNARFYQSDRGQFLSQDPIFWEVGQSQVGRAILQNPQLLNSYAYAADNPITGKDPDGRLVELMTRPISGPLGTVGAHGFVAVIPENPNTIGSIPGVNMSRPFTLGGYTNAPEQWNLYKEAGTSIESTDYSYAFGGNTKGAAQVIVNPPSGMTQEEFERRIVESYNGLPSTLSESSYGAFGQIKLTGKPNSNNTASSILLGAGVSGSQINSYQTQLYAQNFRVAPGLGTSAFASTYGQSISSGLNATLNSLKSALTTLLGVLSSKK